MDIEKVAKLLKVISDPKRIQLLNLIRNGTQCNCEFSNALNLQPNLISHHLRILKEANLVIIEKDALDSRWIYYMINEKTFKELQDFMSEFLDVDSIKPRSLSCGPSSEFLAFAKTTIDKK